MTLLDFAVAYGLRHDVTLDGTGEAAFDVTDAYRYALARHNPVEGRSGVALWCGLNPSSAGADVDDPTVTREMRRTWALGFPTYAKVNAYGLVSTDPKGLARVADPVGRENNVVLTEMAERADLIVLAWGAGIDRERAAEVVERLRLARRGHDTALVCLGVTKSGEPRHPLYLRSDTPLVTYPDLRPVAIGGGS